MAPEKDARHNTERMRYFLLIDQFWWGLDQYISSNFQIDGSIFEEHVGCAYREVVMTYQRISRVGTGLGDQNELCIVRSCDGL